MTDFPAITALPTPPARGQDPAVFIQRADAIIDAIANTFIAQLNAFGPQLSQAIQERVTNAAAVSYQGAADAEAAAIAARDQAQQYAASIDIRTGTTEGKVPLIGPGDVLPVPLIPYLRANGNLSPDYAAWMQGSVSNGVISKFQTGASGWGINFTQSANGGVNASCPPFPLPKGVDLTVSMLAWADFDNVPIYYDIYPDDLPGFYCYLDKTPRLFSFTFNSTSDSMNNAAIRFFMIGGPAGCNAYLTDIKIEVGARATAWTRSDANVGDFIAGTAGRVPTTSVVWGAAKPVALVDAASIAVDLSKFLNAMVTLGGNRTLASPAYVKPGQAGIIEIFQDGTGGRTLAFGSGWSLGSIVPTLSTAPNARDVLYYQVLNDGRVDAYLSKGR